MRGGNLIAKADPGFGEGVSLAAIMIPFVRFKPYREEAFDRRMDSLLMFSVGF
jgi:hypothetical protein